MVLVLLLMVSLPLLLTGHILLAFIAWCIIGTLAEVLGA